MGIYYKKTVPLMPPYELWARTAVSNCLEAQFSRVLMILEISPW